MGRKGPAPRREIAPDPLYGSVLVAQLVNKVMRDGKKTLAQKIVWSALEEAKKRTGLEPVQVLKKAVDQARPTLEVRSRRVGGATYQVPVEVPSRRGVSMALRWIVRAARERRGRSMVEKLSAELVDAVNGVGGAVRKKEELHKMAEANKAFAHYRW